jgi:exosortase/archaeosortase family protein
VPTATPASLSPSASRNFVLKALGWSLGIFGVLKVSWIETHVVLPFTLLQGQFAESSIGAPALPINITLACSGADALALCAGAILAYPATWRQRITGTTVGVTLVVALNIIRIGTLGRAAASPLLFETLHVYVWPALLITVIAGYVFGWMHLVNRRPPAGAGHPVARSAPALTRRFILWAALFVALFVAASPVYLQSAMVLTASAFIARHSASALRLLGVEATAAANVLWTSKGGFEVTQECISTPLVPLYFAAVMAYGRRWRWRLLAFAAAVPLFVGLGITRLLVVALPSALIGSPAFLIHAFYQFLLAALIVCGAAAWRRGPGAWPVAVISCLAGILIALMLAPVYVALLSAFTIALPFDDAQGAMASMPSFQAGFFIALSIATMTVLAWRSFAKGLATLALLQLAVLATLHLLSRYSDLTPQVRDVRAWAIAGPVIVLMGLMSYDRARR